MNTLIYKIEQINVSENINSNQKYNNSEGIMKNTNLSLSKAIILQFYKWITEVNESECSHDYKKHCK